MTDEEAKRVALEALGADEDYGDLTIEMRLVKAGYQAAMVAVIEKAEKLQEDYIEHDSPIQAV